jgi:hypothetical protein
MIDPLLTALMPLKRFKYSALTELSGFNYAPPSRTPAAVRSPHCPGRTAQLGFQKRKNRGIL